VTPNCFIVRAARQPAGFKPEGHIWVGLWTALADNRSAANAILSASALVAALLIC
jgi:hypothetical protein